ncbi:unnamed protein product [Diamesa hyperborea]
MVESEQQKTEDALKENMKLLEESKEAEKNAVQLKKDLDKEIEVQKHDADKHELEKQLFELKVDLETAEQERSSKANSEIIQLKAEQKRLEEKAKYQAKRIKDLTSTELVMNPEQVHRGLKGIFTKMRADLIDNVHNVIRIPEIAKFDQCRQLEE